MSLLIKNQLKTTLNVGNAENLGKVILPSEGEGVFASWCGKLNRQPATDLFRGKSLNTIKKADNNNDIKELLLEANHKKWLKEIDARMKKLGFSRH